LIQGERKPPVDAMAQTEDDSRAPESLTISYLVLDEIRRDGGTQPRAAIDLKHVKLLEEQMEDGKELEPVTVFYDGTDYWLADGFHRFSAHSNRDCVEIACIIYQGSRRDAVLYSVGANADHKPALPRSREDKRRAVMTLLCDQEWQEWSNYKIAAACRVNEKTVRNIRSSLTTDFRSEKSTRIYKTKHGTVAKMNTANIGKTTLAQPEKLQSGARVIVTIAHPLFPSQSGTIWELPNPDSAIVEFDTGERELIDLKHLNPATAPQLHLHESGLVEFDSPDNKRIHRHRGRIAAVGESTVEVWVRDIDRMMMHSHILKHQQVKPLLLEEEPQLKEISQRLSKLRSYSLDPFEVEILNLLERPVVFTPTELEYLAHIEKRHGIVQD
jgi:ParB-like nuclease domain